MPICGNDMLTYLAPLMRSGVFIPLSEPCTLRHFLECILGLPHEYIEERVQIILLNGLPVDELDTPLLHSYTRLALSAAMPGYGSAVLRRNSTLKCLRGELSLETSNDEGSFTSDPFWVELRLFNDIAIEQGNTLFRHGFAVSSANLTASLNVFARPLSHELPLLPDGVEIVWLQAS